MQTKPNFKIKINVKSVGQECPTHTCNYSPEFTIKLNGPLNRLAVVLAATCIGPSARQGRGPQDDRVFLGA
jgi:hypothetical protein